MTKALPPHEQLLDLVKKTGLSVGQVARLFNKSGREIYNWGVNKSVPEDQVERLQSVHERIMPLGYSPTTIMPMMLKSSQGKSLYQMLVDEIKPTSPTLHVRPISVRDSLGL
jgi:hypothetical protein